MDEKKEKDDDDEEDEMERKLADLKAQEVAELKRLVFMFQVQLNLSMFCFIAMMCVYILSFCASSGRRGSC